MSAEVVQFNPSQLIDAAVKKHADVKQSIQTDPVISALFNTATERVRAFATLESYEKDCKDRVSRVQTVLDKVHELMSQKLSEDVKAGKTVPFALLPRYTITGSVAHGTSYADGDVDFAWVVDAKTPAQLEYIRQLFKSLFFDAAAPKKGKTGTILEKATFFMGFDITTKAGLPWVPFNLDGIKYDQTFRLASVHQVIETAAAEGYKKMFGADLAIAASGAAKLDHMHAQHWLQIVKSAFAADKAKYETLYNAFEAVYMDRKKLITPDGQAMLAAATAAAKQQHN